MLTRKLVSFRRLFNLAKFLRRFGAIWNKIVTKWAKRLVFCLSSFLVQIMTIFVDVIWIKVNKEIAKIKENYLLNTKVSFQPFNQPIEIGKIVLSKRDKNQNSNTCQSNPIPKSLVASSGDLKLALTPSTIPSPQTTSATSSLSDKHNTRLFLRVATGRKISTVCFDRTGKYIFTVS